MTDFRALCAELATTLAERIDDKGDAGPYYTHAARLVARARAALAEQPVGPTLDDILELCADHEFMLGVDGANEEESAKGLLEIARAILVRWGQPAHALSDGYHTFTELYEHRHALMLALMHAKPTMCWFSRRHSDGELPFGSKGWFIAGAELPAGAITYHLPTRLLCVARATGATELTSGKPWDGHTANDVVTRLSDWASSSRSAHALPVPTVEEVM